MITPANPEESFDQDDDAQLPQAPAAPWQPTGYRDENARLLLDAIYRHREALYANAGFVPVQGYEVIPANIGPSGGVTCGLLITLWHASPLCRGACPVCGDEALAMAFGGDDEWLVMGVFKRCGYLAHRSGPKAEILAALDAALEGTRYSLPGWVQLMSGNGHQHTALLEALWKLREVLLPAPHYGFAVSTVENMLRWANPVRARSVIWAQRATPRHALSRARVEETAEVTSAMVEFVAQELMRTGALPELERAAPDQLVYCFPMISQEPVPTPVRELSEPMPWEEEAEDADERRFQACVDAVVESFRAGALDANVLERVKDELNRRQVAYDDSGLDAYGTFLSPEAIATAYRAIDDNEVRLKLEISRRRVTRAQRFEYLEKFVLPVLLDDADETRILKPVVLRDSSGHELMLVASVCGYSFSGVHTEWWGPMGCDQHLVARLKADDWIESVEEFAQWKPARKVRVVTSGARVPMMPHGL